MNIIGLIIAILGGIAFMSAPFIFPPESLTDFDERQKRLVLCLIVTVSSPLVVFLGWAIGQL